MKTVIFNILIQVFWLVVCGVITLAVSRTWLNEIGQPWKSILCGFIFVAVMVIFTILTNVIKSFKDPDVLKASELKMDIRRYKKYREWYDEHQRLMSQYGIESKQAEQYFLEFFKQIKNPNEWRRYQDFRYKQSRVEWDKWKEELYGND